MYYYSGQVEKKVETILTIDTRSSNKKDNFVDSISDDDDDDDERGIDYLSFCLKTKFVYKYLLFPI